MSFVPVTCWLSTRLMLSIWASCSPLFWSKSRNDKLARLWGASTLWLKPRFCSPPTVMICHVSSTTFHVFKVQDGSSLDVHHNMSAYKQNQTMLTSALGTPALVPGLFLSWCLLVYPLTQHICLQLIFISQSPHCRVFYTNRACWHASFCSSIGVLVWLSRFYMDLSLILTCSPLLKFHWACCLDTAALAPKFDSSNAYASQPGLHRVICPCLDAPWIP